MSRVLLAGRYFSLNAHGSPESITAFTPVNALYDTIQSGAGKGLLRGPMITPQPSWGSTGTLRTVGGG